MNLRESRTKEITFHVKVAQYLDDDDEVRKKYTIPPLVSKRISMKAKQILVRLVKEKYGEANENEPGPIARARVTPDDVKLEDRWKS